MLLDYTAYMLHGASGFNLGQQRGRLTSLELHEDIMHPAVWGGRGGGVSCVPDCFWRFQVLLPCQQGLNRCFPRSLRSRAAWAENRDDHGSSSLAKQVSQKQNRHPMRKCERRRDSFVFYLFYDQHDHASFFGRCSGSDIDLLFARVQP